MKIGIDVSMITESKAGIGHYAYSLLKALINLDKENTYYLFTHNPALLKDLKLPENFLIINVSGKANLLWMIKCIPIILRHRLKVFVSPSNLFWGCILRRTVTIIHDIGQVLHPQYFHKKGNFLYRIQLNILLRYSKKIVVPSTSVYREIKSTFKFINTKIFVITEGVHEWVFDQTTKKDMLEVKERYSLPDKFILSVGTLEPRKNLNSLILGFKEYLRHDSSYKLVIVGKKGWFYESIFQTVKENSLEDSVIFLGYVPDKELPSIYDQSTIVACLSTYEGFGLPLIESNARNKIVLYSNIPVFKELNINGVAIDKFFDSKEIAKGIKLAVSKEFKKDPDFFDKFSWHKCAEEFLKLF